MAGKTYIENVRESGYLQVIDEDHILLHTDRYEGSATETFARVS